MTIRVFLLDDHELIRRGLTEMFEFEGDIEVVDQAGTVAEALRRGPRCGADVAVLDVQLPDGSGIDVCRALRSACPEMRCLMLTGFGGDGALLESLDAGASGYALKLVRGSNIVDAVRKVAAGLEAIDPDLLAAAIRWRRAAMAGDPRLCDLTPRESRILHLIAQGLTNRQIGTELHLSEKTVKNYVSNVLAKMGMHCRTEAAVYAARLDERRLAQWRPTASTP